MFKNLINTLYSPLEQFQNISMFEKYYQPYVPELYLFWNFNDETMKMIEFETDYFFLKEDFYDFLHKIEYLIAFLLIATFPNTCVSSWLNEKYMKYTTSTVFLSWIVAKLMLYVTTFNNISVHYVTANVPIESNEISGMTIEAFAILENHGGFLFTDSFLYFISAMLFLYLCTGFQYLNYSKGPFIANTSTSIYIQLIIHKVTIELLSSSIDKNMQTQRYHAFIYILFVYLIIANLQGLIPFNITVTSQLITTFFLALAIIIYITVTILAEQGLRYLFSLFMPSGAPLLLGYLLVPIEFISFFFKTVSLSVRLFANMMAGHTLLKVILGFAWTLLGISEIYFIVNFIPVIILILLSVLEIGVSLIQAYIFSILSTLYLRDAFSGH